MSADQPEALLRVEGLKTYFPVRGGVFLTAQAQCKAVDDVSIHIGPGETLGLVGESGCGKSTLGKTIVRLIKPTGGRILFDGSDLSSMSERALKPHRRQVQMIFQDPADSLNSRHSIGNILEEPFIIHGIGDASERDRRVAKLLDVVGLPSSAVERFPFEFSGGQRQRIGIARAVALNPKLIICDEPVSALDVSIQSQILNLMLDLQQEMNLSYLFIAHDLAVVKHVSDRIAIMYLGRIVEMGGADEVYERPKHPYTQALISAIPEPVPGGKRERQILAGDVPSPIDPPSGCAFHTRCPHAQPKCSEERPELRDVVARTGEEHVVACHFDV
ncbi:MAG: dipeptide ABC transporter ATP-binding protein [Chromatiales bacterium]|nr:dipeptide ABC transporter ATP-binding protein [Chromatiales bacterium]